MKFATQPIQRYPSHLSHVATLPWEIKNSFFADIQHAWKNMQTNCKLHFKYTDFNSPTRVTVYSEGIYVFLSKSCPRL